MSSSTRIAGYSLSGASQIAWFIPLPSRSPAPGHGDHSSEDPSPQGDRVSSSVGEPLERSRWVDHQSVLLLALVVIWAARPGSYLFRRIRKAGKDARFDAVKPTTSTPSGASSRRARAPTSWCSARTSRRARPSRSAKARSCSPCSAERRCTRIPTSERRPARPTTAGGSRGDPPAVVRGLLRGRRRDDRVPRHHRAGRACRVAGDATHVGWRRRRPWQLIDKVRGAGGHPQASAQWRPT